MEERAEIQQIMVKEKEADPDKIGKIDGEEMIVGEEDHHQINEVLQAIAEIKTSKLSYQFALEIKCTLFF
jgi:hypothetical protein